LDLEASTAHLNGVEVTAGDCLVPNTSGQWRLIRSDGEPESHGDFLSDGLPDTQNNDAFLSFGTLLLGEDEGVAGNWLHWSDRSPIAPGLGDAIKSHPLEIAIERDLGHLTEVCGRPQTHIRLEPERLITARARRFDRNVYVRLASHTVDWAQRKLTGVQPSHVLAQVREEQWDLYENRVAVRLIDALAIWLRGRLSDVQRILNDVLGEVNKHTVSGDANWRRSQRLYQIWGGASDATAQQTLAEQTRKRLENLLYRVLGLMDSPLYRAIPNRAQVPPGLRMTNLFSNHDHYRGVARLWDEWSRHHAQPPLSPSQLYRRHQRLIRGFDVWCLLLIVRGLRQLCCELFDEDLERQLAPGCDIKLQGGYRLTWQWDGIRLLDGDQPRIRFVPLLHAMARTKPANLIELTADIIEAVANRDDWTVILTPAVPGSTIGDAFAGVVDLPFPTVRGALDVLRVSPLKLDSVERISRLLRWAMLVPRMLAYPPYLGEVPADLTGRLSGRISPATDGGYMLHKPLADYEIAALGIDTAAQQARSERDRLHDERNQVDQRLRASRGDRREMANLNRQKKQLSERIQWAETNAQCILHFQQTLSTAQRRLTALSTCPICGESGGLEIRDSDCFVASCPGCKAQWDLRPSKSGERIPVLVSGKYDLPLDYRPSCVDDVLGCDVLAIPSRDGETNLTWRTPRSQSVAPELYGRVS
jgi:hypothetical protein